MRYGLVKNVCKAPETKNQGGAEEVLILQESKTRVVSAYHCAIRTTKVTGYCAIWSHLKMPEPLDVGLGKRFPEHDCHKAVRDRVFVTENKNTLPIEINRELVYKDIGHGEVILTKNDVQCRGSTVDLRGEIHDNVITYDTTTVLIKEIKVEIGEDKVVNLDNNQELPASCQMGSSCTDGLDAFVFKEHVTRCPLYAVRTLYMNTTTIQVDGIQKTALVSHEHKMLLIPSPKQQVVDNNCRLTAVRGTQYRRLKLAKASESRLEHQRNQVTASQLDLELETRVTDEYLSFKMEEQIRDRVKDVSSQLCEITQHDLEYRELSPFQGHSIIKRRGELIVELQCAPVMTEAVLGEKREEKCSKNALPVYLNREPVYLAANTRLVSDKLEVEFDECDRFFPPVFEAEQGGLLTANPVVTVANLTVIDMTAQFHLPTRKNHEIFAGSMLYTDEEVKQYNNLLHFQRIKAHVVEAMVQDYCEKEGSCSGLDVSIDLKNTGLSRIDEIRKELEDKVNPWSYVEKIHQGAQEVGSYCSLFIVLYMTVRYLKLTFSLMRAMIMERLSFREAYGKCIRPDLAIYNSLAALHRALELESGTEMYRLDQNARSERLERTSLLPPQEDRNQHLLRKFQESFETSSQNEVNPQTSGTSNHSAPKAPQP